MADEAALRVRWSRDVGTGQRADDALAALLGRYREPHRRYHGVKHVAEVLAACDELLARSRGLDDPAAVRLAAWFHDAVYDPRAVGGANEASSATLAARVLGELGVATGRISAVQRLVLMTAQHRPQGPDEAVLADADLAILAARPAVYEAYRNGVRAEYAHVNEEAWRVGRASVLRSFLDRTAIYLVAPVEPREHHARANLAAELALLG
ncbi:MAG TPA: hypothetical protein VF855_05330 [Acidimicrobiales bacterium]